MIMVLIVIQDLYHKQVLTATENLIKIRSDKPHNLGVGDQVIVRNVQSSTNSTALLDNKGYNGTFLVAEITNDKEFRYSNVDTAGVTHTTGTFTNNTQTRSTLLPRFDRNNNSGNFFIYRTEVITPYIQGCTRWCIPSIRIE